MMIPESRADQGYSGLGRVSSNGVSTSNNAMEILSRFRPIAPKPSTPKPGESAGSAPSDPPSSSTLSFERTSGGKAVSSERSRVKRNRKRIGAEPLLPPTRRAKRGQTPSKPRALPTTAGGIQKAVEQFAPDKSGSQPMIPVSPTVEYRQLKGGASNASNEAELASPDYMVMGDASAPERHAAGWARPDRRKFVNGFGAFKMPNVSNEWVAPRGVSSHDAGATPANEGPVGEEPAFMGRAAAASSSQPFSGREINRVVKMKGNYDRGFENYPRCVPDEIPYSAGLMRPVDFMTNNSLFPTYADNQWPIDRVSHARSNGDSEVISDGNSRQPNLVTLSLLPDTPSQSNNSPVPIKPSNLKHLPCLELSLQSDTRDWQEAKPESPEELHKFSLFSRSYEQDPTNGFCATGRDPRGTGSSSSGRGSRGTSVFQEPLERLSRGSGSSRDSEDDSGIVMDTTHMEQQYSASSDPIMLSGDLSGEILWANQAYVKADAERNQRLKEAGAPYLDDLGIPTKHSSFEFLTPQGLRTEANLWGFLKKFMTSESEPSRGNSLPEGRVDGQAKETRTPERKSSSKSTSNEKFSESSQNTRPNLSTSQPIRPVGSTLTMEHGLGNDFYAPPITESVERVKEERVEVNTCCDH